MQDSSDWKLHQKVYLKITKLLRTPSVGLFASRLCHQLPQYMTWKPDPNSSATDAMQQDWNTMFAFAFPPFSFIIWVINKVLRENVEAMILVTSTWQTQPWHTLLLRMSIQRPLLLPARRGKLQENLGNGRNFKQCSKTYLHVQETRLYCRLRIGLQQVS